METIVGWREWAALPEIGIQRLRAKLDSGAHSCALHAVDIEPLETTTGMFVRFRLDHGGPHVIAPLAAWRRVKDSGGHVTLRPTLRTTLLLGGRRITVELTLADRSRMKHRLIIGRRVLARGLLVHSGRTFLHPPPTQPTAEARSPLDVAETAMAPPSPRRLVRAVGFEPTIP